MKTKWRSSLVLLVCVGFCSLAGLWLWDANDYPMPGVPEAPPTPFQVPIWEKGESLTTTFSRIQERLRSRRFNRLQSKWNRELDLADTFWKVHLEKATVHFGEDGSISVKRSSNEPSSKFEVFQSYNHPDPGRIIFYTAEREPTYIKVSALNENSLILSDGSGSSFAIFDRVSE